MAVLETANNLRLAYTHVVGEFRHFTEEGNKKVAHAATVMMRGVQDDVKTRGRRTIAVGGFSKKWQNAFRVNIYPKSKESTHPAIWAYHKIIYAGVFEKGATIHGNPIMWIPLPGIKLPGRGRITPDRWVQRFGPLVRITSNNGNEILLGKKSRRKSAPLVPIFVGESTVHLKKRFDLHGVFVSAAAKMPSLYLRNMKD